MPLSFRGRILSGNGFPFTGGPVLPSDLSELGIWLNAGDLVLSDDDPVSVWADASGEGRDFTALDAPVFKTGVINGHPAVLFDGVGDILSAGSDYFYADNTKSGITLIAVVESNATTSDLDYVFDFGYAANNSLSLIYENHSPEMYATLSAQVTVQTGTAADSFHILIGRLIFGTRIELLLDGMLQGFYKTTVSQMTTSEIVESPTRATSSGPPVIGGQSKLSLSTGRYLDGYLAEFVAYRQALSDTDLQSIVDYFADKYGLTATPGTILTPAMTSNTTPAGCIISSNSEYNSSYAPWHAFMQDNTTSVSCYISQSPAVLPEWLQMQFTSAVIARGFTFQTRNGGESQNYPTSFKLQGSNNGTDWTDLHTVTGLSGLISNVWSPTYKIASPGSYTYYRFYMSALAGSGYVTIGEFALLG
jgi:hypothetical protein